MRTKNELYQEALRTVARRRQTARARAEDARAEAEAALPGLRKSWMFRRPLAFHVLRMLFQYHRSRFGPACTAASCTMASS